MRPRKSWGVLALASALLVIGSPAAAQVTASLDSTPPQSESPTRRFHLETAAFDNIVSNGFGHWAGARLRLSHQTSRRLALTGESVSQRRPGETQRLFGLSANVDWSRRFYSEIAVSGGGPDDPAAFFPRFRFDLNLNFKVPEVPGLILTGGLTRLTFGNPVSGRVARAGAIYYWRQFVFQGLLHFNNVRPGNRKSKAVSSSVQYGQEGRYWLGLSSGGGREAWQTLALTPQDVDFTSYSGSLFLRKWLAPSYGVAFTYNYSLKRAAYRIQGVEMKFFLDF